MSETKDPFGAKGTIEVKGKKVTYFRLKRLEELGIGKISILPHSIKILLEAILRHVDGKLVTKEDVEALAKWDPKQIPEREIPYTPSRIVLQDFTGVPAVVDLAALRSAMERAGGNPDEINPVIPADLVIDHSVQVDYYGTSSAIAQNEQKEFERNNERYVLLRWAQEAFDNFRVVPPRRGIVHQVNLEHLASVVQLDEVKGKLVAYPDTLVGTDSHTTMINGLGVLGWGVGGIEAEAVMLGQPYYMPIPEVIGFKLEGELKEGVTATDLVLTVTKMLREYGVVGKFVEFFGKGLKKLSLPDRATISNMTPEYGATVVYFPVDEVTLDYLKSTARGNLVDLVKTYMNEQGLFLTYEGPNPEFVDTLELDLSTIEPCLAGPKLPQERIPLQDMKARFLESMEKVFDKKISAAQELADINHGSVVIAALTSCTNTSNPAVMIGAGLVAKKAVEHGLRVKPYVKTSLAPGSRVVSEYLEASGLISNLEALGFYLVGYGCTTCIGNSGPLPDKIVKVVKENDLVVAAVLSGNRNFEGRINPHVRANYLASPMLVVAFAIAGTVAIDLTNDPLGYDPNGSPVYLKDIWPTKSEIQETIGNSLIPEMFDRQYSTVFKGTQLWKDLDVPEDNLYGWDEKSTYIQEPPFFQDFPLNPPKTGDIKDARVLALLGDSITTDHISPAGDIPPDEPAGKFLISQGVKPEDFNSFGSRRGNHEVMMRGTFCNIRLKNQLLPGKEGGWTRHLPSGEEMAIYDAAMRYAKENTPLIVLAGKEYGSGSSRDWAAKGTYLLGVKAIIAVSYERIHRSNLVGMGVLPLQFKEGDNIQSLGLKGNETFDIVGDLKPHGELSVLAKDDNGKQKQFNLVVRLDTPVEIEYYRNGGILHAVLRNMIKNKKY